MVHSRPRRRRPARRGRRLFKPGRRPAHGCARRWCPSSPSLGAPQWWDRNVKGSARRTCRHLPGEDRPAAEIELGGLRAGRELELVDIHPEDRRAVGRFEIVALGADVGNRAPDRRGDVRLVGIGEAQAGPRSPRISEKAVATASALVLLASARRRAPSSSARSDPAKLIVPGRKAQTVDALPIGVDGELLVEDRRVGHHRVFRVVVDDQLAADILEDGAVARGVGEARDARRPCCHPAGPARRWRRVPWLRASTASATVA